MVRVFLSVLLSSYSLFAAGPQSVTQAQELEARGDWHGAEEVWHQLALQSPKDYRLWASLGIALVHQNRFDEAIAAYQKALALNAHDPQTNFNLGLAYFKAGKFLEAVKPLRAAATASNTQQVEMLLGMSLFGVGKYQEAATHLEQAGAGQTDNPELQQVLAECYLYGGEYEKARLQLESLLRRDPDSASVHMFLGEAEDASGHLDRAIEEFRQATAKRPIPNAHFGLGYLLWKDHQYDEAAGEFRKELATDPNHYQALAYLGDILLKQGDKTEAEKLFKSSIKAHDGFWLTHFDLGVIEAERKEYASAVADLQKASVLDPSRAEPHYRLAQIFKVTGDGTRAQAELKKVSALHRQSEDSLIQKISGSKPKVP
jgi:tetratricopeptide (TPR) repeat protein